MSLIGEVDMLYKCTISQYQITRWWQLLGQSWVAAYLQSLMRLWFPRHAGDFSCSGLALPRCCYWPLPYVWPALMNVRRFRVTDPGRPGEGRWVADRAVSGAVSHWPRGEVGSPFCRGCVREVRQVDTSHL